MYSSSHLPKLHYLVSTAKQKGKYFGVQTILGLIDFCMCGPKNADIFFTYLILCSTMHTGLECNKRLSK